MSERERQQLSFDPYTDLDLITGENVPAPMSVYMRTELPTIESAHPLGALPNGGGVVMCAHYDEDETDQVIVPHELVPHGLAKALDATDDEDECRELADEINDHITAHLNVIARAVWN